MDNIDDTGISGCQGLLNMAYLDFFLFPGFQNINQKFLRNFFATVLVIVVCLFVARASYVKLLVNFNEGNTSLTQIF